MVAGLLAALALACSDHVTAPSEPTDSRARQLRVTPSELELAEGESEKLEATPVDASGNAVSGYSITWRSTEPSVASVNGSGMVTVHHAEGSVMIEATAVKGGDEVSGSANVRGKRAVAAVTLTPTRVDLLEGHGLQLKVSIENDDGDPVERKVKWSSTDESVVTVDDEGVVTAMEVGEAIVEASVGNVSDSATVAVFSDNVASVAVSPKSLSVTEDDAVQLEARVEDEQGQSVSHPVTWSSHDTTVARVDSTGRVTTRATGSVRITATARATSTSGTATVDVEAPEVASIEASPSEASVQAGQSITFTATITDSKGDELDGSAEWSSTDTSVATVQSDGTVTGLAQGEAGIMAAHGNVADTASVTVTEETAPEVASLAVSPSDLDVEVGDSATLSAEASDADGNELDKEITWTSLDEEVATVNGSGLVTAVAVGSVLVVAECEGLADTVDVTVRTATTSEDTASPPPTPGELSLWEDGRTDTEVTYETSWSASDGADSYRWTAGSNDGLWDRSGSGVTALGVSFTAPRSDGDDESFFCVKAVNEQGESEQRCSGFTVPAVKDTSSDGDSDSDTSQYFKEDFTSYSSTADLMSDPNDIYMTGLDKSTEDIVLDGNRMRYDFPDLGACSPHTITRVIDLSAQNVVGSNQTELWVQVDATFDNEFDTSSPNTGRATVESVNGVFQVGERLQGGGGNFDPTIERVDDNGDGTVTLWWSGMLSNPGLGDVLVGEDSGAEGTVVSEPLDCGSSPNPDYKFIFGLVSGGKGRFSVNVGNGSGRQILVDAPAQSDDSDVVVCQDDVSGQESIDGSLECELRVYNNAWGSHNVFDGRSHQFRMHWRLPSSPSAADGVMEIWLDGVKLHSTNDVDTDATEIYGVKLGANMNISALAQSLHWEQVQVWASNPGW